MAITTSTLIPPAIQTFYNRVLLERALPYLPHSLFGQMKPVPMNSGDQPRFRRYGSLTTALTPLTEGVTPPSQAMSKTDIDGQLKQYGSYVEVTDYIQFISQDRVLTEAAELLGENAGETLDCIYRDILSAGTTIQYANSVAGRSSIVTKQATADYEKIMRTLRANLAKYYSSTPIVGTTRVGTVPIAPCYYAITDPYALYDTTQLSGFTPAHQYANPSQAITGEVGAYKSIRFIESTNAKVFADSGGTAVTNTLKYTTASTACDVHTALIFGKDAYGICPLQGKGLENIIKPLGSGGTADPLNQRATSAWKATTTCMILNDDFMLRYEFGVSA